MSNANFFKGGAPLFQALHCDGNVIYTPPFNAPIQRDRAMGPGFLKHPPGTGAIEGATNLGDYSLGMPFDPEIMPWQRAELANSNPKVGDILRFLVIPEHHYVDMLSFSVVNADPALQGMTVSLASEVVRPDMNGVYTFYADTTVFDAAQFQGVTNIDVSQPTNQVVSLQKVVGDYVIPLYVPMGDALAIGIKIESMPTDTSVKLEDMKNAFYLTVRAHGFMCPAQL